MALVEINWHPSRKELRVFGVGLAVFAVVIAAICYRYRSSLGALEFSFAGIAILSLAVSIFSPDWLHPVYCVFMVAAFPIGFVLSHVILAVVYYAVFTPIGLTMRLLGRDPMQRQWDPDAESYWVPHQPRKSSQDYFRQS